MKYKSKNASIETLKRFFRNHPDSDELLLEELFASVDRDIAFSPERNRAWLSNLLTHLKYYDLYTPVYSHDGKRRLKAIRLTLSGKKALGRIEENNATEQRPAYNFTDGSINDVAEAIKKFQKANPEFDVMFNIKLKEKV